MMLRAALFAVLMATPVATPAWAASPCPLPGQKPMLMVKMYFGQAMAGRRTVSPRAWQRFLSDAVTSRFPDGFTVYDAYGQWMDPKMRVPGHERTKVVEIATPDSPANRAAITDIANRYREDFHQQSVGVVTSNSCAAF